MINCQNSETYFSAFYDKELADDFVNPLTDHMSVCKSCEKEYEVYEKAMNSMGNLNFGIDADALVVPNDFTQNVMARVRVATGPQHQSVGSWKFRAVGFAVAFLAYAFYMISVTQMNKVSATGLDMARSIAFFNLFLVGLSLSFMFFTREFVGFNSKMLCRLSASYQQVTSMDVNLLRMAGASIFLGVFIGKFVF
ncbi:MAG: hypothetical protein COA79_03115 [Planctomycetota bacterium]|nr:MAG: hypothetical protein COA79_03115 [Planctomycetota bacterium]